MSAFGPYGSLPYSSKAESSALEVSVGGSITPNGTLLTGTASNFAILVGVISPAGALFKRVTAPIGGSITPEGVMTSIKLKAIIALSAALSFSGDFSRFVDKRFTGTISPLGGFVRQKLRRPLKWIESFGFIFRK